jgi:hypothetical protein
MVIRARLIPHVVILAYSNSKFISDYIRHTWSDFHMVKSQLSANDWLAVQIWMSIIVFIEHMQANPISNTVNYICSSCYPK